MNGSPLRLTWLGSNVYVRMARREWHCICRVHGEHGRREDGSARVCGAVIAKGTRYAESLDSAPAYASGERYCWDCATTHGALVRNDQPWRHKLYGCRRSYIEQRDTDPRSCECGGQPDDYYSLAE